MNAAAAVRAPRNIHLLRRPRRVVHLPVVHEVAEAEALPAEGAAAAPRGDALADRRGQPRLLRGYSGEEDFSSIASFVEFGLSAGADDADGEGKAFVRAELPSIKLPERKKERKPKAKAPPPKPPHLSAALPPKPKSPAPKRKAPPRQARAKKT